MKGKYDVRLIYTTELYLLCNRIIFVYLTNRIFIYK
jgi:hypothetical protein